MHHHLTILETTAIALSIACATIQGYILFVLLSRRVASFRIFTSYTALGIVLVLVAVPAYLFSGSSSPSYFYTYWVLSFLYMGLEFGVMYEIFANSLKPYSALVDLGKLLFAWATIFLLVAATLTGLATAGPRLNQLQSAIGVVEHSMRLMQCGLLFLFFLFQRRLGLSWRSPNISIGLGLGVTAAVDLCVSYVGAHFANWACQIPAISSVCYLGVLSFWALCLALPQPVRKSVLDSPSRLIFQRWNEALTGYGYGATGAPSTVESFLPGIEKTVDRVMARRVQ